MQTTLANIANIRSGHSFREKIEEISAGDVHVLQIKDLRRQHNELHSSEIEAASLPQIKWQGGAKAYLKTGDVVVPARGDYNQASLFKSSSKVIASNLLFIITIKDQSLMPAYVCWAINQNAAQHYLASESRGSNMPALSSQSLAGLAIPVPPPPVQQKIVELQQLWEHEQRLTEQLLDNRKTMLEGMFQQLIAGVANTPDNGART
ncbi:MAG: restriction endonuclease subunit S [Gammaproteobacteria bacterium]|nr:restriction endonuclease subunit S [Gammaproteobacteria bacterium]